MFGGFGNQNQQQQQQQFGSPFGGGGFNNNMNSKNAMFGSNTNQNPTFGSSNASFVSTSAIPSASSTTTFGISTMSSQNPTFGGGSQNAAFVNNQNAAFGISNQNSTFGSSNQNSAFGNNTNETFGSSNNPTFGTMAPQNQSFGIGVNSPFGTTTQNNTMFGSSAPNNTNFTSSPFSSNAIGSNTNFSSPSFGTSATTIASSTFGSPTFSPNTTPAFGVSSTTSNPFSSPSPTTTFNASTASTFPFNSPSSFTPHQQQQPILFGSSTNVMESEDNQEDTNDTNMDNDEQPKPLSFGSSSTALFGTIQEEDVTFDTGEEQQSNNNQENTTVSSADKDLAALRAKIQEKKKRLEEQIMKQNNHASADDTNATMPAYSTLKFASLLPKELNHKLQEGKLPKIHGEEEDEKDLIVSNDDTSVSTSLLGTCKTMCPDEEILQRTVENDIQSYEVPSTINPNNTNWDLRDTCIKRFRRSAADYKLNVPSLIRPPYVLEKTMGYMEEWLMELDRRKVQEFPSLDVYQFLWDRTRMIRKDFILQNYIAGPNGNCSSVAVRVHERIARWHIMMEHQLSHLQEFVTYQSSLNVQELGQTMKTLNLYYDDSGNRSTVLEGGEAEGVVHGCQFDTVQGGCELVDYDGTTLLRNDSPKSSSNEASHRLIGTDNKHHGTSEAEMRGLYILLTMNNDSGMEVVKYASKLYQEKPSIYHSSHVQLALKIFQVKKDNNYARFFSILRNPTTPYLYACLMFKYVESMRKIAFRIMSRAFGGRKKDTGESMYDSYPLQDLVHLLCFEDETEAKKACDHYNIKVKQNKEDGRMTVYWRHSDYCEPTDPKKEGVRLSLKPLKMSRTIECKLKGATRLMICRGDVNGYSSKADDENLKLLQKQQEERLAQEKKRKEEEYKKLLQEKIRIEQEKLIKIEQEKKLLLKKQQEELLKRKQEEERRKETERLAKLKAEQEEARKKAEAERIAKLRAEEEARISEEKRIAEQKAQAERLARLKAEKEAQEKAEAERIARLKAEEEQRQEELRRKQQHELQLEQQRQRQIQLMIEKQQKEKREEEEWKKTINAAKLQLVLRKWRHSIQESYYTKYATKMHLSCIDPTKKSASVMTHTKKNVVSTARITSSKLEMKLNDNKLNRFHDVFLCCNKIGEGIDLSSLLMTLIRQISSKSNHAFSENQSKIVILCKVLIILPHSNDKHNNQYEAIQSIIQSWLAEKLSLGTIQKDSVMLENLSIDIRVVTTLYCTTSLEDTKTADLILYLIPPLLGSKSYSFYDTPSILEDIPRIVLVLTESTDRTNPSIVKLIDSALGKDGRMNTLEQSLSRPGVVNVDFELKESSCAIINFSLTSCCEALLKAFMQDNIQIEDNTDVPLLYTSPFQMEIVTVESLGRSCILGILQRFFSHSLQVDGDSFVDLCHEAVDAFSNVLKQLVSEVWKYATDDVPRSCFADWPSKSFADGTDDQDAIVSNYFHDDKALPINWVTKILYRTKLERALCDAFCLYHGSDQLSMVSVANQMLQNAPAALLERCEILFTKQDLVSFWNDIFSWKEEIERFDKEDSILYLPKDMANFIIQRTLDSQFKDVRVHMNISRHVACDIVSALRKETPKKQSPNKKRHVSLTTPLEEHQSKRSRVNKTSKQLEESRRFTKLLKSYYRGDSTVDLKIGKTNTDLTSILASKGLDIDML